ncbi:MAG: threonine/serine exporter family protein [Thermincolia bacterium]
MVVELITAFWASLFFGIIFTVPRNTLVVGALGGSLAWLVYKIMLKVYQVEVVALFIAALVVAVFGETMARVMKKTTSTLLVPAIVNLVPGAGAYYTMLALVKGDYQTGLVKGATTIFSAGAIAAGLAIVAILFRFFTYRGQENVEKASSNSQKI